MLASVTLPLALSGDQWITLSGVLSGAVGVVGGYVFAYVNGKAERLHTRQLALTARMHEQRLAAYVEIGTFLERQYLYVRDVAFVYQLTPVPRPDPPEPLTVDEWTTVMGRAKVSSSPEVLEALNAVENTSYELDTAIAIRKAFLEQPEAEQMEMTLGFPHSVAVEEVRMPAMKAVEEAERRMREELAATT